MTDRLNSREMLSEKATVKLRSECQAGSRHETTGKKREFQGKESFIVTEKEIKLV